MRRFLCRVLGVDAAMADLRAELAAAQAGYDALVGQYADLFAATLALQREVTEATDGQVAFVPRVVSTETPLIRQHNLKQFHAVVEDRP